MKRSSSSPLVFGLAISLALATACGDPDDVPIGAAEIGEVALEPNAVAPDGKSICDGFDQRLPELEAAYSGLVDNLADRIRILEEHPSDSSRQALDAVIENLRGNPNPYTWSALTYANGPGADLRIRYLPSLPNSVYDGYFRIIHFGGIDAEGAGALVHELGHGWDDHIQAPGFRGFRDHNHLHVSAELRANTFEAAGDFTRALLLTSQRYGPEVTQFIEAFPEMNGLSGMQSYAFVDGMATAFPNSSPFDASGARTPAANGAVANLLNDVSRSDFTIANSDVILPRNAGILGQALQCGTKALPVLGVGAGLFFFTEDVSAAQYPDEYAHAVCGNLIGLVPVVGDGWDIFYGIGGIIAEVASPHILLREVFFDDGDCSSDWYSY